MTAYYKLPQRGSAWNFYKLLGGGNAVECVSFLNKTPQIYFEDCSALEYQDLKSGTPIEAGEYAKAFSLATSGKFSVYLDGKKQSGYSRI